MTFNKFTQNVKKYTNQFQQVLSSKLMSYVSISRKTTICRKEKQKKDASPLLFHLTASLPIYHTANRYPSSVFTVPYKRGL